MIVIFDPGTGTILYPEEAVLVDIPEHIDADDAEGFCDDAPKWQMPSFTRDEDRLFVRWDGEGDDA